MESWCFQRPRLPAPQNEVARQAGGINSALLSNCYGSARGQQRFERTALAQRRVGSTEMLADHDQLRVVVLPVMQSSGERFLVQRGFAPIFQLLISRVALAPAVPAEDPPGVGVDDEAGMPAGVEQHAVGGLGADAVDGE